MGKQNVQAEKVYLATAISIYTRDFHDVSLARNVLRSLSNMAMSERNNCWKYFVQIVDLRSRTEPTSACSVEKVIFYPLISAVARGGAGGPMPPQFFA